MLNTISQRNQRQTSEAAHVGKHTDKARRILSSYMPITLSEMDNVALLNRTDTKFVMSTTALLTALGHLSDDYRVLETAGVRQHQYRTLYFDTADFDLYHRHHAGAANRYKVRSRAYVESELAFLEVKHKTNKKRTIKERLETDRLMTRVNRQTVPFLKRHYPYEPAALLPVLLNSFIRITLVSRHRPERLTLDFNLHFRRGLQTLAFPGVAIAEVKQEGFSMNSDFIRQMRALGVRPTSFSKYCLGASALYPRLKQNNFKSKHLMVQKVMQGQSHAYLH